MSQPFIGEIKLVSFNFPPRGWAFCNGQLLPINQNQALFSILGTMYGGDGQTTFALPNLKGRTMIHAGNGYVQGQNGGAESHTLTINEMPQHVHPPVATTARATTGDPTNAIWATTPTAAYAPAPNGLMADTATADSGGSQPHENRPPFLVLNYVIALVGIFPSRN
ncbi:MAG: tail collar protein [Nocardioidaceae bacterium]|nr:tail collar protein [Nocardioidaceae bacterium]